MLACSNSHVKPLKRSPTCASHHARRGLQSVDLAQASAEVLESDDLPESYMALGENGTYRVEYK
jgi:hypothetical protein